MGYVYSLFDFHYPLFSMVTHRNYSGIFHLLKLCVCVNTIQEREVTLQKMLCIVTYIFRAKHIHLIDHDNQRFSGE